MGKLSSKPRGGPRIPDEIKRQKGTLKPHRAIIPIGVKADQNEIIAPDAISGVQREEFDRIVAYMSQVRLLSKVDVSMIRAAALEWSLYLGLRQKQEQENIPSYYEVLGKDGKTAIINPHPCYYIANKHLENYTDLLRELAISPMARIKAGQKPEEKPKARIAGLLKKTGTE